MAPTGVALGTRAPNFALPSAAGETVSLAHYAGHADVVLDFLRHRH
jgi:peroxiredoxin